MSDIKLIYIYILELSARYARASFYSLPSQVPNATDATKTAIVVEFCAHSTLDAACVMDCCLAPYMCVSIVAGTLTIEHLVLHTEGIADLRRIHR